MQFRGEKINNLFLCPHTAGQAGQWVCKAGSRGKLWQRAHRRMVEGLNTETF